uniref:Ig-like domain-containing protein n=1 Tax=Anopheles culicifacies TaxID=139723 RepID=A0A182LX84_9DIPT
MVEDYWYSDTQGYKISFNRLEDGGSYYCQVKDKSQQPIHFQIEINEHCEFITTDSRSTTTATRLRRTFRLRERPHGVHSNAFYIGGDGVTSSHSDESFARDKTGNWPGLDQVIALRSELLADRSGSMFSDESLHASRNKTNALTSPVNSWTVAKFKRSILDPFENSTGNNTFEVGAFDDGIPMHAGNNVTEGNSTSFENFTDIYDYLDGDTSNETLVPTTVSYANATKDRPTTTPPIAEYLTKPSIQSDTKDHVPLGQRIRLVCNVKIRAGVKLEMTWKVPPNLRPAVKDGRTKIGPLKVEPVMDAEHREIASRELIIERATLADDGTYRCEVQDLNSHRNYHSFKLHVRDSAEDFVELREENNLAAINMHPNANGKTAPINIVIKYDSYPSNITYYWLKDDDEITAGHNGKYLLSHSDTHVRLRVNDPKVFDTGNYTVYVLAGNAEKAHRMAVHVYGKTTEEMIAGDVLIVV